MSDKRKRLERLISKEKLGGVVGFGDDITIGYEIEPTPFVQLNAGIGGGLAKGRHTCVSGPPGTGKTCLALQTVAHLQNKYEDYIAVWLDAESAFDPAWARTLGVDVDQLLIVSKLPKLEDYLDAYIKIIGSGYVDMIVLDSIGSIAPRGEQESPGGETRSVESDTMGLQARKYAQFFRIVNNRVDSLGVISVFIAQVYRDINSYGGIFAVKGGEAFKHTQYLRLMTRRSRDKAAIKVRMGDGKLKEVELGWDLHVKVDKSKQSTTEGYEVVLPFRRGAGIVASEAAILTALNLGIIARGGAWYKWNDEKWQGKAAAIEHFRDNADALEDLSKEVMEALETDAADGVVYGEPENIMGE